MSDGCVGIWRGARRLITFLILDVSEIGIPNVPDDLFVEPYASGSFPIMAPGTLEQPLDLTQGVVPYEQGVTSPDILSQEVLQGFHVRDLWHVLSGYIDSHPMDW